MSLTTSDGLALDGQVSTPTDRQPAAAAVLCHPHPLYGGSMHANVVQWLFDALPGRGITALRFDFRGVGASEGSHGGGRDERLDVVAAIDEVARRHPSVPIVAAGYSFGADVALAVGDERIAGWLAVSPPLRIVGPGDLVAATDARPKVVISGSADEYRDAESARTAVAEWPNSEVLTADGVDHFWGRGLERLDSAVTALLARLGH